jgi:hypothetical protein
MVATARALVGEISVTAFRMSSLRSVSGLGTMLQAIPFQCSVRLPTPECLLAQHVVPTVHASFVELALTPFKTLLPANAFGLETSE